MDFLPRPGPRLRLLASVTAPLECHLGTRLMAAVCASRHGSDRRGHAIAVRASAAAVLWRVLPVWRGGHHYRLQLASPDQITELPGQDNCPAPTPDGAITLSATPHLHGQHPVNHPSIHYESMPRSSPDENRDTDRSGRPTLSPAPSVPGCQHTRPRNDGCILHAPWPRGVEPVATTILQGATMDG